MPLYPIFAHFDQNRMHVFISTTAVMLRYAPFFCLIFLFGYILTCMFSEETNFVLNFVYVWSPYTQAHIRMQLKISTFYKSNLLTFKIRITYHMALYFSKHNLSISYSWNEATLMSLGAGYDASMGCFSNSRPT